MPDLRTEITEIATGLGMLDLPGIPYALERPPVRLLHVSEASWSGLRRAFHEGQYRMEFERAWDNGRAFLLAPNGLRHRIPLRVEWKGSHRPPAYEQVPADLRIDHVYLVSCKYQSRILFNPSPPHLFDRGLSDRHRPEGAADWYGTCAPEAYQEFYSAVRTVLGPDGLPDRVEALQPRHRDALKRDLRGSRWPASLQDSYRTFCAAVANATAIRWSCLLSDRAAREKMLWRLLRFSGAPYFVLGESDEGPLRYRVSTPWDWRQAFDLLSFEVAADRAAGQPQVKWSATVRDRERAEDRTVAGHVEVRWSHGRFCGHPEAKVYLETPHGAVPGYYPL